MKDEALKELRKCLLLKYGTAWNTPTEYWQAALDMTERALIAEKKILETI